LAIPPTKTKKTVNTDTEYLFQNHHFHFNFLCSSLAYKVAILGQETNMALVADHDADLYKNFLADEGFMETLFKHLLDHHPNFVPPEVAILSRNKPRKLIKFPKLM